MRAEDLYRVSHKVVVVTGGANGHGFAIARAMSDNGARVVIFDVDRSGSERAVQELCSRGGKVRGETVDVTDAAGIRSAFDRILEQEGGLDVVFANAEIKGGPGFVTAPGMRDPTGEIESISNAEWERVLGVNLHGVFRTIQCAVPHLKKRGRGRIILTAPTAAAMTSSYFGAPYAATKAAIAHLVRQLALELARFGITVNTMQPGSFQDSTTTPEPQSPTKQTLPAHRIGRGEEIEGLALFFASDASSFVTGAHYDIDGDELFRRHG
jgi:NAD(P)-dependent dehydrogenase (short-subunit alcohol dehydrogenase family)